MLFQKKNLDLIFCSSISSQLSYILYLENLKGDYDCRDSYRLLIVTPPASAKIKTLKVIDNVEKLKHGKLILTNRVLKIIFFLGLQFLLFFKNSKIVPIRIKIIEPRPNWHRSLLGESVISSIERIKMTSHLRTAKCLDADKYIYFGDGFSQYCRDSKPFWLERNSASNQVRKYKVNEESFAAFDTYKFGVNRNFNRIPIGLVKKTLDVLYFEESSHTKWLRELESNIYKTKRTNLLIILSGTTLSKTGRSSLNAEVSLYIDYLNKLLSSFSQQVDLIYKPHPGSNSDFNEQIKLELNKIRNVTFLDLPDLAQIPLEFLLRACEKYYDFKEINLIALSSGAVFSSLTLRNRINIHLGFGEELVKKSLNAHYSELRLQQEKILASLLNEYID